MLRYLLEKEFKQIRRDRFMPKIIFIIPIMQLIILPFAANFEMRNINLSIVDNDHSVTSMQLVDKVLSSGYFRLTDRSDRYDEALTSVESNESDIILEIPSDFERDLGKEGRADVMIAANAVNGTKGGLGSSYLSSIIQDFNREKGFASMGSGRGVASINLFNPHLSYKIYMVPGIMVFLLTIIGGSISALNIVSEKEKGTIEQINVSPVPKSLFLLSKLIPFWVIGFVLLTLAILIAWLIYGLVPEGSFGVIYLFAAVYLIAFTGFDLLLLVHTATSDAYGVFLLDHFRLAKRIVHADQQYAGMGAEDHAGESGALFRGGDAYGLFKGERLCRFTGTFCDCLSICCFF